MRLPRVLLFIAIAGLSPSGFAAQLLVLNKGDATLTFFDAATGKGLATIGTGTGPHEIEVSRDGRLAVVSNYGAREPGNSLSIIDVAARKELRRIDLGELHRPHGLAFANGHFYFTAEQARKVARLDANGERVDWTFDSTQDVTHMVLASRDGTKLITANIGSNSVGIIERHGSDIWQQTLVAVGAGPEGLDLAPDGRELWVAHSRDGGISVVDVATKQVTHKLDVRTKRSNRLKFTPDGAHVLVSDLGANEVVVLDARKRTERTRLAVGQSPTGVLVAPDGKLAYVACSGANEIAVIDLESLTVTKKIVTGTNPDGMAWITQ